MRTLLIAATVLLTTHAVPVLAADGQPGPHRAEREARFNAWCQANADKCREVLAWRQQCQADLERCRAEMRARREARRAQCQADPEKCRAEVEARVTARFRQADANGDGGLSREEAQKAMPRAARHFDRLDANQDGVVTLEEMQAARKARFESRRDRAT
jgi:hypothetical protein